MKFAAIKNKPQDSSAMGGVVSAKKRDNRQASAKTRVDGVDQSLKLKPKEALHILIQLKSMVGAGVPLLAALRTLVQHASTPSSAKVLTGIGKVVESGNDLSYAFDCFPRVFPKFCVHLIAAGEQAGALDESMDRCAELMDKQIKLGGRIKGALAYPGFLLIMTFVMTTGILAFLVPKFEGLLMSKPEHLPTTTKWVLSASHFIRESPYILGGGVAVLLVGLFFMLKNRKFKQGAFDLISHVPAVGTLIHKAFISRSVTTLALTLESGVPILTGLEHAREVSELPRLQAHWESASAVVRDGRPMHTALADADLPPALIQMIIAGESSGSLDKSLRTAAEFLDRETEAALALFTGLLGPLTVVIAGAMVGFIVVSLMTPILTMAKYV